MEGIECLPLFMVMNQIVFIIPMFILFVIIITKLINTYEPEWFETELAKQIVREVDDSEVLSSECIQSPVLGQIPPERLSGGVKTLLLILNEPEKIFNASTCGDNCAKWILEIGKREDVTINLRHMMDFGKDTVFEIKIKNGGEIVHSMKELIPIASKYLNEMKQE